MIHVPRRSRLRDQLFSLIFTLQSLIRQRQLVELVSKAFRLWRRAGAAGVWRQFRRMGHATLGYASWVKQFDTLNDADRGAILKHIDSFRHRPIISVLMPTYNSPERWLRRAIESVRDQLYPEWELCIADDASNHSHVRAILEEYQRLDERIKIVFRGRNGHISAASNSALELANGKFVALLDHDDELPEHALYMVALAIEENPELNLIYSDEDKIDEYGRRFGPYFKPDWNPDLFNAQNMVSHLGVYRTKVIKSVGGFRTGFEGSQDWDLALRVAEKIPSSTIRHIPAVLYHWRAISGSAALGHEEKSYVASSSQRVVCEHLQRINQSASVEPAFSSFVRIRYPLPTPAPLVSIILLGDLTYSEELIRRTHYPALEIIPYTPCSNTPQAELLNRTAKQARGELLCFINADLLPKTEDWLEELVVHARRPEIGAVGPMHLDVVGNIQGALTVLCGTSGGSTVSWSFYKGAHHLEKGVAGRVALQQNVTILATGCLILRTETFQRVSGFDSKNFPNALFELDLCLRLVQAGYRNLWTPYARIVSTGALGTCSDASNQNEVERFRFQWRDYLDCDPTHNPNLAYGEVWPVPANPPRATRSWSPEVKLGIQRFR